MSNETSLFHQHIQFNKLQEAKKLFADHPELDVNWIHDNSGYSALHYTAFSGCAETVRWILSLPNIDPNIMRNGDASRVDTPFRIHCMKWRADMDVKQMKESTINVFLEDQRVTLNDRNHHDQSPADYLARVGNPLLLSWWIASGRKLDTTNLLENVNTYDIKYWGTENLEENQWYLSYKAKKDETKTLIENFLADPAKTRKKLRLDIGWYHPNDSKAATIFAMIIFICDGLLQAKKGENSASPASRFFEISSKLPMELQIILCHRVIGSMSESIHGIAREKAFEALAKKLLLLV